MSKFTVCTRVVVRAEDDYSTWVVEPHVVIEGTTFAQVSKNTAALKRFLKCVKTYQTVSKLMDELNSLRAAALSEALNRNNPFGNDSNTGETDTACRKTLRKKRRLLQQSDAYRSTNRMLEVTLPGFETVDGQQIPDTKATMPCVKDFCSVSCPGEIRLPLESASLQWISERCRVLNKQRKESGHQEPLQHHYAGTNLQSPIKGVYWNKTNKLWQRKGLGYACGKRWQALVINNDSEHESADAHESADERAGAQDSSDGGSESQAEDDRDDGVGADATRRSNESPDGADKIASDRESNNTVGADAGNLGGGAEAPAKVDRNVDRSQTNVWPIFKIQKRTET